MSNRYYTPDKTKWTGRTHIAPGSTENRKMISHFIFDGPENSPVHALRVGFCDAIAAVDSLREYRQKVQSDGKLTDLGVAEAVGEHAVTDAIPKLRRAKAAADKVKAEIAARAATLTIAKPDPNDGLGERQRAEIRTMLRSMADSEREKFVEGHRNDPAIMAAIIHAPTPALSGVSRMKFENLREEQLQREHGEGIAENNDLGEVLQVVDRVCAVGREELRELIGVDRNKFEALASVAERNEGRMPFRVDQEVVDGKRVDIARVLDLQSKTWRRATAEEVMASRSDAAAAA